MVRHKVKHAAVSTIAEVQLDAHQSRTALLSIKQWFVCISRITLTLLEAFVAIINAGLHHPAQSDVSG